MPQVIVYSTPTCPYCHQAKEYLQSKNIPFTDYNAAADPEKAEEMFNKSGQMGVPVIDIDGQIIVGFDKEEIDKLIGV